MRVIGIAVFAVVFLAIVYAAFDLAATTTRSTGLGKNAADTR